MSMRGPVGGGLATLGLAGVAIGVAPSLPPSRAGEATGDALFAAALVDASEVALLGVSGWLALATALSTIAAVRGPESATARVAALITPRIWARVLSIALGGAVCVGPAAGHAAYDDSTPPGIVGLGLPDRPADTTAPTPGHQARAYVVRRGDTLWDIAADELPNDATVAERLRACQRWYAANRTVIGDDPDLLLPGTRLYSPTERKGTP